MSDLTLFELEPATVRTHRTEPVTLPARHTIDREALARIALLYTATEKGNNSGVRFAMSLEDAQAWCSSGVSCGCLHGTHWGYFWTSALNFIECHWGTDAPVFDFTREHDSGEWDERIASLGLVKYGFADMVGLLAPMGVTVLPPKGRA